MTHLGKSSFSPLSTHGEGNYLIWALDVKLHLQARNLAKKNRGTISRNSYRSLWCSSISFHATSSRPNITIVVPYYNINSCLWVLLQNRFNHQKSIFLPNVRYNWIHLRIQDYPTIAKYNTKMYKIAS